MEYIVSGSDMKKVDEYAIKRLGIPSMVLMERAALSVVDLILCNEPKDKKILVVSGVGNNGADGVAIARILSLKGYDVTIYVCGVKSSASEEFLAQLDIAKKLKIKIVREMVKADVIVDAIFGVGVSRNVIGIQGKAIKLINKSRATVYSVDLPSGINADTGEVMGVAVEADYTVAIGCQKIGNAMYPGTDYCGEISVGDIGYPVDAYDRCKHVAKYVDNYDLSLIPVRPNYSFKGSFGKVLIIAGNDEMAGAAAMCGMSAYRVGAGLVRIFTDQENKEVIQKLVPEAVLNVYDSEEFDVKSLEASIAWADVIAIGPGLGLGNIQDVMVEKVLDSKKPCVVDADAINTIAKNRNLYKKLHAEVIMTPHLGEMSRLTKKSVDEIKANIFEAAKNAHKKTFANYVLKDARTVVASGDDLFVNMTGNNGMATAGSGDVLTGIIVGLLGIGVDFNAAAVLGPYIHGYAGDKAAERVTKTSLMASDIIEELTTIFKQ